MVGVVISVIIIILEWVQLVFFFSFYFKLVLAIVVQDGNDIIKNLKDLEGKRLVVAIGIIGVMVVINVFGVKVINFDFIIFVFQELVNGNVDVVINDCLVLFYVIKDVGLRNVKISVDVGSEDYYGIVMFLVFFGEIN